MKKILVAVLVVGVALMVSGCAGDFYPIDNETIQISGQYTKDASVAKEEAVHKTLRNRDTQYASAYATSGMKVKFKLVEITPGVFIQTIEELAMKESPRFYTALPTAPSVHPVWHTLETLGGAAIQWTGVVGLANQAAGVLNKSIENSGTKYNGPYNPQTYSDSFNQTAEPFIVQPEVVQPVIVQ